MFTDKSDKTKDIEFMNNPNRWTAIGGCICPLRHATKQDREHPSIPHLGFLAADHGFKVYVGVMYEAIHLDALPVEEYQDAEEVYAAGWRVD